MHLRGVRPAGDWNLFARFCRLVAGCRTGRRGARIFRRADLNMSGQNNYVVGATISGDVTIQFVILILPILSFLETGPGTGGVRVGNALNSKVIQAQFPKLA